MGHYDNQKILYSVTLETCDAAAVAAAGAAAAASLRRHQIDSKQSIFTFEE